MARARRGRNLQHRGKDIFLQGIEISKPPPPESSTFCLYPSIISSRPPFLTRHSSTWTIDWSSARATKGRFSPSCVRSGAPSYSHRSTSAHPGLINRPGIYANPLGSPPSPLPTPTPCRPCLSLSVPHYTINLNLYSCPKSTDAPAHHLKSPASRTSSPTR